MSNDSVFKYKKDPFNKGSNKNPINPITVKQPEDTNKIDISLLSDADRAYYLAHGTLPTSKEEEAAIAAMRAAVESMNEAATAAMNEDANTAKTNLSVVENNKNENVQIDMSKSNNQMHHEAINEIIDTPTDVENNANSELTSMMESFTNNSETTSTQSTNVVTNWDDVDNTTTKSTEVDTEKSVPTPTPLNFELPSFANRPYVKNDNSGVIDPVKQQQLHDFLESQKQKDDTLNIDLNENTEQENTIVENSQEEITESIRHDEDKQPSTNETEIQDVPSSVPDETPKEISVSEQEASEETLITDISDIVPEEPVEEPVVEKHFDTPVEKTVEEFDSVEESTESDTKVKMNYGIVASDVNNVYIYNELNNYVEENYNFNNDESIDQFRKDMEDETTVLFKKNLLSGVSTANRDLDQSVINEKDLNSLVKEIPDEIRSKNSSTRISSDAIKNPDKIISGKQASMIINATVRGTKKVFLYNSGFWVIIRPLTNFELSEFINSVRNRDMDYGRALGGHFYLYATLEIKRFFAERIKNIVIDSNLQGWKQGDTLIENLSLHDFKTILWASACMMFKDGVEFTKICSFCNNTENISMNLSKLDFYNFDAIKDSAFPYISEKRSVSTENTTEYRNRIVYDVDKFLVDNGWKYIFKVPSLQDYINFGDKFMNLLLEKIKNVDDVDGINNFVRYTHCKQYAPWIKELQQLDENKEIIFRIVDGDTIFENIDSVVQDSKEFFDHAEKYIKATMLTYIAFPYIECPKCHKVPTNIMNGFVAYDIESAFFTMSVRKSEEISSLLKV